MVYRDLTAFHRGGLIFVGVALAIISSVSFAQAGQATLSWATNTEIDLAGYKIHYGESSGSYTLHADAGKVTTYTVTGLAESKRYYFVVTAYDTSGNESSYSTDVIYSVPDINITGNGQSVAAGDLNPSTADNTDYGTVSQLGGTLTRTFTVQNLGTAALNLTGAPPITVSGAQAADFTVSAQAGSTVAPGGTTTFQVTFAPSATGLRTATLTIASNDPDENPYTFGIQGTGTMPTETASAPAAPAGPASGYTQVGYAYTANGSTSSFGDAVQYQFDWGDTTTSSWLAAGTVSASKTWTSAGTYQVKVRARCAVHTTVVSAWSASLPVSISADSTPPAAPQGFKINR